MTPEQKQMAVALAGCTFCPGIGAKRFARDMGEAALRKDSPELTPKQAEYLARAVIRFRRQIVSATVALAHRQLGAEK